METVCWARTNFKMFFYR